MDVNIIEKSVDIEVETVSEDLESNDNVFSTPVDTEESGNNVFSDQQQAAVTVIGTPKTQSTAAPGPGQSSQRVFTGTVTKCTINPDLWTVTFSSRPVMSRVTCWRIMTGCWWRRLTTLTCRSNRVPPEYKDA